jgi:hypothetical protein
MAFRATRSSVDGTVTFTEGGPQWGAFHPGGDEQIVVPIQKWDRDVMWWEPCDRCGDLVEVGRGTIEVLGAYHSGCFGWPASACTPGHLGECTDETRSKGAASRMGAK